MNDQNSEKKLPPSESSIYENVKIQWENVLKLWEGGWHAESKVERIESYLEFHRTRIFDGNSADKAYDWETDWLRAATYHDHQRDFVLNRRKHNEDLKAMWSEWHERASQNMSGLSFEALRGMILVDGAAILACLTLLSGQIEHPNKSAIIAAKVMLLLSIVSLLMMVAGHSIAFLRANDVVNRVRGTLVGFSRHKKLYAVSRYLRRYFDRTLEIGNALVFGSIFVFALGAAISAIILIIGA